MKKIAIIGAGITGSTLAYYLNKAFDITIFEKSRGVGGRLATRRTNEYIFNHGAQYFQAKTPEFKKFLAPAITNNFINPYKNQFKRINNKGELINIDFERANNYFIGAPNMNWAVKYFIKKTKIKLENTIIKLFRLNNSWYLKDLKKRIYGPYNLVIITTPVAQALELLKFKNTILDKLKKISMSHRYSMMLGFKGKIEFGFNIAIIDNPYISRISVNNTRTKNTSIVIQTTHDLKNEPKILKEKLMEKFIEKTSNIINYRLTNCDFKSMHFWRYAQVKAPTHYKYLLEEKTNIGVCGDWMVGKNVEDGFISAKALSQKILNINLLK